jgi:hypothetical protein
MTQDRIDLLDQLGFSWEVRPTLERPRATWQQRLEELTDFKIKNGNFKMDPSNMPQLNAWCHEQRQRLRQVEKNQGKDPSKRMNNERIEALAFIGFTKDAELLDALPKTEAKDGNDKSSATSDNTAQDETKSDDKDTGETTTAAKGEEEENNADTAAAEEKGKVSDGKKEETTLSTEEKTSEGNPVKSEKLPKEGVAFVSI